MIEDIEAFAEGKGLNKIIVQNIFRAWLNFFRLSQRVNSTPQHVVEDLIALGIVKYFDFNYYFFNYMPV